LPDAARVDVGRHLRTSPVPAPARLSRRGPGSIP
jgi:hypothetical protein